MSSLELGEELAIRVRCVVLDALFVLILGQAKKKPDASGLLGKRHARMCRLLPFLCFRMMVVVEIEKSKSG